MTDCARTAYVASQWFGQAIVAPARQPIHRHGDARLIVYLGGEMLEETFEGSAILRRGDFAFRPPYFAHANIVRGHSRYVRVPVSQQAVQHWLAKHGWAASRGHLELDKDSRGDELLSTSRPHPYIQQSARTPMQRVAKLLASDCAPSVQQAARVLDLAPHQLTRLFRREYGVSPVTYRRQARLQRAVRMLLERSASLAQIAALAGYHDQSHLTTAFRDAFGIPPAAFAKSVR